MAPVPLNAAGSLGVELEKVRPMVYPQFQQDDVLLTRIQVSEKYEVSDRLCRIPILVYPGSQFSQFTPDGSSMGVGGGERYDNGVTTPVYFSQAVQVTKEAEWTTNSESKSVVNVLKDSFKINLKEFRHNIDALLSRSDSSGTLGTVVTASTAGQLTVDNANNFQAQNTYQIWTAALGAFVGTITVNTIDPVNNILYLIGTYPGGTAATNLILVNGAAGTLNASLNGIPYINFSANTGQWFGINRASYPGVLTTPYVNGSSAAITPFLIQQLESYMQRKLGVKILEEEDSIASANVDQLTAWEGLGMVTTSNVSTAFLDAKDGGKDERYDYMKKKRVRTIAGHELVLNLHALPGRIDLIVLKHWFRVESKPCALFDVDGLTIFPLYGNDGGVASASAYYFVCGLQVATDRPGSGGYIDTLSKPF